MSVILQGYTASGAIDATIDGLALTIPDDMANRHRQMIAEWEAAGNTIPPYVAPAPTIDDVVAERSRRLALGFDYDFGDRGVHHIATTEQDLKNWDEVTKLAAAYIAAGQSAEVIAIKTETGAATVTAAEWQLVLIAAGAFRQPIFQASFVLQAMDPIPADYTDDRYWS